MKRLLTILLVLIAFVSFGQPWITGQTKPPGATSLQALNNVTWHMNKPDTTLGANISGLGYYKIFNVNYFKKFRLFSDTTRLKGTFSNFKALGKQDKLTITTSGTTGPATLIEGTLNIPQYVGGGGSVMVYPDAGIPTSTGLTWGTSITNNSANWNTAYGWGDHAGLYAPISGSVNYIQNGTTQQTSANFNISGSGVLGSTIQSITAKLTNLTDGYLPYHISDASGLGNSPIYTDGAYGVGINTSSPNYLNPIRGSLDLNGSQQALFSLSIGGIGSALFFHTGTDLLFTNEVAGNMGFNTNGARRFTITAGGNVDVGFDGARSEKFAVNGSGYFNTSLRVNGLSGTGTRLTTASNDGTLGAITNGTNGQVLKIVSGVPVFADESGGGIDESGMTANFIQKWDGTKFVDWINPRPQTLTASLTTVWDVNSGIDANMTMTGDASITLQNLKVSTSGTLHITKQSVNRRLKIKGYTLSISRNIEWDSTGILITGNSKEDSYTWTYNGVVLTINGNKDYNQTSF